MASAHTHTLTNTELKSLKSVYCLLTLQVKTYYQFSSRSGTKCHKNSSTNENTFENVKKVDRVMDFWMCVLCVCVCVCVCVTSWRTSWQRWLCLISPRYHSMQRLERIRGMSVNGQEMGESSSCTVKAAQAVGTRAAGKKLQLAEVASTWFVGWSSQVQFNRSEGHGCKGHCQSDEHWNCLKDNRFGKLLWRTGWSAYGFLRGHTAAGLPPWRLNQLY